MAELSSLKRSVAATRALPLAQARQLIDKLVRSVVSVQRIGRKQEIFGQAAFTAAGEAARAEYFGDPTKYPTSFSYPCSLEEKAAFYNKYDRLLAEEARNLAE
jgi:hypothetical protein